MIPIPQMAEALSRGRHDIVRNSLEAQIRALTSSLSRSYRDDDVDWNRRVEEDAQRLAVLLETICQHAGRASSQSNQRLIQLTTSQIDGFIRYLQGLEGRPVVLEQKRALEEMVTFHVSQLQSTIKSSAKSSPNLIKKNVSPHVSQMHRVHWDRWSALDDSEVIRESALDGRVLSIAQDFLISNRSWSRDNLEKEVRVWLLPVVEAELRRKNLDRAKDILQNMGCDIWEEIKSVCLETSESSLRNYLLRELNDLQMLSPEETDASKFIILVQGAAKNEELKSEKELEFCEKFPNPESLSISYILQQPALQQWKNMYITHLYFHTADGTLEPLLEQNTCWCYLLSNNQVDLLRCWVEFSFHSDCPKWYGSGGPQFVKRIGQLFKDWPITQEMIDQIDLSATNIHTKDTVLNALCSYGKLSTREQTDIRLILLRLSRSRRLCNFGPDLQLDVPWPTIQKLLFDFCVEHNLPELAVIWRLDPQPEYTKGWPKLYNVHSQLAASPENLPFAAECLQRCVEYLAEEEPPTPTDRSPGNSLFLVANLLLNAQSLSCIFSEESSASTKFSASQLKEAAADFPLLRYAVKENIWPSTPDVDLYSLLQDCTTCNINRIFQWRFTNRKSFIEDDSQWCEYPHFSSERLISRFGYNETLSLSYYLREGRPSFAACTVLVEGTRASGRISNKALKDVCLLAHGVALQYFSDSRITASCVAFIEMLGRPSTALRTQIAVAKLIYTHDTICTGDHVQSYPGVSTLLEDLSLGHQERSGREMLSILDRILEQKMCAVEENDSDCFIKDIGSLLMEQGLAARFAAMHRLPYPERFVRHCARRGHWIVALLFCQIHGYPQSLVFKVLEEIPDQNIRHHLRCVFARRATKVEPAKLRARASRPNFYSRLGGRQEPPMSVSVLSKISRESSESEISGQSEVSSDVDALPTLPTYNDLLELLVKCHSEPYPATMLLYNALFLPNPTLAIIAVCYERDWELRGMCSWLAAWLSSTQRALFLRMVGSQHKWTAESSEQVLTESLKGGLAVTMQRGFAIFVPDNPLKILADTLVDCIENRLFDNTTEKLKRFFEASHDYKLKIRGSEHFAYEHSWLARTAIKLCTTALVHCFPSSRHQYLFLKAVSHAEVANQLNDCNDSSGSVAKFGQLARIVECLMPTDVHLNIDHWLHNSHEEHKRCVDLLLKSERYEEAIEFTKITNLPVGSALTTQLAAKLQQCLSELSPDLKQFWKECETKLTDAKIGAEIASKFYRECSSRLTSSLDRFIALRLALRWLRWNSKEGDVQPTEWQLHLVSAEEVENIEKEMWMHCIQAGEEAVKELKETTTPTPLIHLSSTTLNARRAILWQSDDEPQSLRGQSEDRVDELIGNLLDIGDIAAACRVETLFGVHSKDLTILLACLTIAEEKMKVAEWPDILSSSPNSPHFKYSYPRQSSFLSKEGMEDDSDVNQAVHSEYVEIPSREKQDSLVAIYGLCERLNHGRRIGAQIAACYRLAMNLDFKFQDVLSVGEPLRLLRTALTEPCWDQIVVALDLLETFQLAPNQVAEFLAREIVSAISKGAAQGCARNCTLWGGSMERIFHRVLNLAPDTALLAKELLKIARRQTVSSPHVPREVLETVTELLIRAHYCYTSACNMEGIASVLGDAHQLTTALADKQEWRLMVRLLTGIQRFTEMSYVFRILKDNKQFECLLRKDIDKVNKGKMSKKFQEYPEDELEYLLRKDTDKPVGLKVALLEWLRRECPEETSLHKMTALHFGMHRELAGLWKGEAETRCQLAVASKMVNNQATLNLLTTVMQDFSHAAEYYLQGNMLTHAVHCAYQAELAALQHYLVANAQPDRPGRQVLLLDSKTVTQLITNTLSFPQAKIVIRAYNHTTDWGSALFQHCVATSLEAEGYLAAWTTSYELTPSLLQDIALRFQRSPVITREMGRNMRRVLNYMQDIEVRYRVASQLGFKDVVEGMLRGVEVAYLKDTVWQSGFRN